MSERFIHIPKWDDYQHRDVSRNKLGHVEWIKDATGLLHNETYLELTWPQRGLLQDIRRQYALRGGRGIGAEPANLTRLFGRRVLSSQVEALNHADFIVITASRLRADGLQPACLDVEETRQDKTLRPPAASETPGQSTIESVLSDPDADIVLPSRPEAPAPRDVVWDELERLFGKVTDRTSGHGARNMACGELRRMGATADTVRAAAERWPRLFPDATLTAPALAKHYPQLTQHLERKQARTPPCEECGMGGGLHVADCTRRPRAGEQAA